MSFSNRSADRSGRRTGSARPPGAVRFVLGLARVLTAVAILAVVAVALVFMRLAQGPIALPALAGLTERMLERETEDARIEIGGAVLTLGRQDTPTGLQFTEVSVAAPDGQTLLSAPVVAAKFHLGDLVRGALQPTEILLVEPRARVLRAEDGRIRVGLGEGAGVAVMPEGEEGATAPAQAPAVPERPGMDAVRRIVDGFVGDAPPLAALSRLRTVRIRNAAIVYEDALSGRRWRTRGSDVRIERTPEGAEAEWEAALLDELDAEIGLHVHVERRRGTGRSDFSIAFDNLEAEDLSEQLRELDWSRMIQGPVSARIGLTLGPLGAIERLEGRVAAEGARLRALDPDWQRFREIAVRFAYDPGRERMRLDRVTLGSEAVEARLSGIVELEALARGADSAVALELQVEALEIDEPTLFAGPLRFDSGQIAARVGFDPVRIDLAGAHLAREGFTLGAAGRIREARAGEPWRADLRLWGRAVSIADLKRHWPLGAAVNARAWIDEHMLSGMIERIVGDLRLGDGEPRLTLSLRFRDLVSRYLGDMPAIRTATGRMHMTYNDLFLFMERGEVVQDAGAPIRLDGSEMRIFDFWGAVTPAEIEIRAAAASRAALDLIDREPLGLVSKLGFDPAGVAGEVTVETALDFPLLQDLRIEQIAADAEARFTDVALEMALMGGDPVAVRAEALNLSANVREMTISGPARVDGVAIQAEWRELYGAGANHRDLVLAGRVTPALLTRFGVEIPAFTEGAADLHARIEQRGGPMAVSVSADLGAAALNIVPLQWSKPAGADARLTAEGRVEERVRISALTLEAPGLTIEGAVDVTPAGEVGSARIDRLEMPGRADLSAEVSQGAGGAPLISVQGRFLDISELIETPRTEAPVKGRPGEIRLDVARLRVTPKISLAPVTGQIRRSTDGRIVIDLAGAVGNGARFEADYSRDAGAPGQLHLESDDAGALLRGIDLFQGGAGGDLVLNAALGPNPETDLEGVAKIRGMAVEDAQTFKRILSQGGIEEAVAAVEEGGFRFDSIRGPFRYADGVIHLDSSVAKSPMLAVKAEGRVDEAADSLDMVGVISPAYALTGALDQIPVLGRILSGGEGEGILAMTFAVTGTLDAPEIRVNPLSLLAPGILRGLFSATPGAPGEPSERFIESLQRPE